MKKQSLLAVPLATALCWSVTGSLALATSATYAQDGAVAEATASLQEGPAQVATSVAGSEFGDPVSVNGVQISDMAIKRFLVYGPGRNALDARKLQILMDHERALRVATVREDVASELTDAAEITAAVEERMKRFDYDPAALESRLNKERADFQDRFPDLDHEIELQRAYGTGDWYRDQVRQTMAFDALFFPDHPDTWPELAVEAIHAGSPNVDLIADYAKYYDQRLQKAEETGEPIQPEQEMMMTLLRDFVMQALWSLAEVKTATQDIPENLAMTIDGDDWTAEVQTQEVFDEMRSVFSTQDIDDAKLSLCLMEAARQKLAEADALMPKEDFITMVADLRSQMAGGMFNMDFMALQGHGFPSSESYEEHLRLVESYKNTIQDKLIVDDEGSMSPELQAHMPIANGIMGLMKCHADILMVSAFDFPKFEWKQDGWDKAYERASGLRAEVDAYMDKLAADDAARAAADAAGTEYAPEEQLLPFDQWWSNFLRGNSDYWDPPLPRVGKAPPAIGLKNFGAFQGVPMTRNDMKRAIGESEYAHFLSNSAIVDKIFFELKPGTVDGPFQGPKGFYLIYLRSRAAPTNPLNVRNDERHRSMLQEDWIRKSFQSYAHDALNTADVKGLWE